MSNWNFSYADDDIFPILDGTYYSQYETIMGKTFGYMGSNNTAGVYKTDSNINAFFCLVGTGPYYPLIVVEDIAGLSTVDIMYSSNFTGSMRGNYPVSKYSYNSDYNLYYYQDWDTSSFTSSYTYICPIYSSRTDALSDIREYIDSGNIPAIKYPFTLQNGYLFVYDLGNSSASYSFDLTSKSEEYSNIGSNPFPDTNQSYWFSYTLPEIDETTIPASGAAIIQWSKGDNTNIFGQTQNMVASISGTSSGRYLYIYNPPVHYKWSGSSNPTSSEVVNYPVIINGVSENENWYIYDSIARLTDFNQGGTVAGTITGEQIIGTVTSEGSISLNTSSGAIYTQNSGGSTDISGANGGSIAENINGLKQTLDNFVNQFIQLLSAPISHIQQLIQSGNSFFEVFSGLFDWLPNEVSTVIISGLIIMVVVGVLKMLL